MPIDVAILGSTGSVGLQTLAVLEERPDRFRVAGLAAATNAQALASQVLRHRPRLVGLAGEEAAARLAGLLNGHTPELRVGPDAAESLATAPGVDLVVVATHGTAGLGPTLAALRAGRTVALANKEAAVAGGELLARAAREGGGRLVPMDSEHAAIHRIVAGSPDRRVERIWLTASGGPFRDVPEFLFDRLGPEHALRHPTWRMGPRTSVLSATMLNKALEVVEARWLFDLSPDRIEVVVHPESIVHAIVEFEDGAVLAALSWPDMKGPIRYAVTGSERPGRAGRSFDPAGAGRLSFERPDPDRFPALALGHRAAAAGGTMGAVLATAADEAARLFLEGRISFPEIARRVESLMHRHNPVNEPSLEDVRSAERWVREEICQ